MGAQWKQAGRVANATKRGALIGKLVKEILVAAKLGDPHPENNPRLWVAVEAAKKQSVPRDTIERAIKKGAGLLDEKVNYELVTYEGFAPHKVPVIVECLTENRNRTAPEIRHLFKDGQFGGPGSVAFMFDRWGIVEAHHADKSQDIEAAAIEAGAQEVQPLTGEDVPEGHVGARFLCLPGDLDAVAKFLAAAKWSVTTSEISYLAKNYVELAEPQRKEVADFLTALDEHDDVHRVYAALK
ncbi:MAG TPA: YebC/PmpR family DNA-binding transcriptional regulator [Verrucomicrobiae bacterium]|jgi:YebC/PmpR family DNA-binding regulatory protein|nr:YebC/PmpR family DNA-binding transcriptional regulator [Verrucomicrobiae bacterium]